MGNNHEGSICLGCAYFGTGIDLPNSLEILDMYYESGGRILDTANCYAGWLEGAKGGESEKVIGEWMKINGITDVNVMTKVGFEYGEVEMGLNREIIEIECEKSLKRLGSDSIGTYFLHLDTGYEICGILAVLNELQRKGMIKEIAASNHSLERIESAEEISLENNLNSFSAIENHYTYLEPQKRELLGQFNWEMFDEEYLDYCKEKGIRTYAHTVMLWGVYFGKFKYIWEIYACRENLKIMEKMEELSLRYGESKAVLAAGWMMKKGIYPIIGASSANQIKEMMRAESFMPDSDIMSCLEAVRRGE